jgi:hydrogenase maturation protein HypF
MAWGGELLRVDGAEFQRLGNLRPLPLPGADRAAQEPWRMAAAALHELGRNAEIARHFSGQPAAAMVSLMLQRNFNCPHTSSMGRVFDAAAGLLGLCDKMEFDAQAAIALEQDATRYASSHGMPQALAGGWQIDESGQLDFLSLLSHLIDVEDAQHGAALFHATLIAALGDWVVQAAQYSGMETLVCGGGCFFNKLLSDGLRKRLAEDGIKMLSAQAMQPGDTAIALGQAWVAAQRI